MKERNFDFKELESSLKKYDEIKVNDLVKHINLLKDERDPKNKDLFKCKWFSFLTSEIVASLFKKAVADGLSIDGKNIVIENRGGKIGLSYNYIAYKNKLLNIYPDAKIDFDVVYKNDDFSFQKKDGIVYYSHKYNSPFAKDNEDIIGSYCIIKIKTGHFLVTLDRKEIDQIKSKAKTSLVWNQWFKDMCLKSAIKKLVSKHFYDIYTGLAEEDNQDYSLDNPIDLEEEIREEISNIETLKELTEYYQANISKVANSKSFIKMLSLRKADIQKYIDENIKRYSDLVNHKKPEEAASLIEDFKNIKLSEQIQVFEQLKEE